MTSNFLFASKLIHVTSDKKMSLRLRLIDQVFEVINDIKTNITDNLRGDDVRINIHIMKDLSIIVEFCYKLVRDQDLSWVLDLAITPYTSDYWAEKCEQSSESISSIVGASYIMISDFGRDDIYNAIKYFHVPKCTDSWIFSAMQYVENVVVGWYVDDIYVRKGTLMLIRDEWKFIFSKNEILLIDSLGYGFKYTRDFTTDFLVTNMVDRETYVKNHEPPNFELFHRVGISATKERSFKEIVHMAYYAYIDCVWPRHFVGFEDIVVATVSIDE